jgi:hypothetical protein
MCEPTTIAMWAAVAGAAVSAYGSYQQNENVKAVAKHNANVAETKAQDELEQGEKDAQAALRDSRLVQAQQRAAFAAKGLDISEGTPADMIAQTDFFGQMDAATARTNARKAAWNARAQRTGYQMEAAGAASRTSAFSSLLGDSGRVADRWQQYNAGTTVNYGG